MKKSWILVSCFNFLVAAIMGLILRGAFVWGMEWLDFRNLMHGHSHVAMLGWVYLGLYALIWYLFIPKAKREKRIYAYLFWFTQMTVMGMMISFPLQGYGAIAISFSSLHILASYFFCFRVWKDYHIQSPEISLLLKTSLVLLILSTLGVWSLGPLTVFGDRGSPIYQMAIQFYLHFQFHGWFTFAVLALVLHVFMKRGKFFNGSRFKRFYLLLLFSLIMTYGLIFTWGYGGNLPLLINGIGVLFQVLALILFFRWVRAGNGGLFQGTSKMTRLFYRFAFASWVLKVLIQTAVLVPEVAVVSFTIRSLMIGFIHLTMLGFVSGALFALLADSGAFLSESKSLFVGGLNFMIGFALTEILLFIQGIYYWLQWGQVQFYYEFLFGFSILLPLGILIIMSNKLNYMGISGQNKYRFT